MGIPQWIMIALWSIALVEEARHDGELNIKKYNFNATLVATLVTAWLLWWGGFFR